MILSGWNHRTASCAAYFGAWWWTWAKLVRRRWFEPLPMVIEQITEENVRSISFLACWKNGLFFLMGLLRIRWLHWCAHSFCFLKRESARIFSCISIHRWYRNQWPTFMTPCNILSLMLPQYVWDRRFNGLPLLTAGVQIRYSLPHARIMTHQPSGGFRDRQRI